MKAFSVLLGIVMASSGNSHPGPALFTVCLGLPRGKGRVKGSGRWGRKGEECAAGGAEGFDSDYFAVLAKRLLGVYQQRSKSF